jgi:hypothetical protein
MTTNWRRRQVFAVLSGTVVVSVVLLSMAMTHPEVVTDPALGSGWQCRRTLFFETCTRVGPASPTAQIADLEKSCPLRLDETARDARSPAFTWSLASKSLDDRPRARR